MAYATAEDLVARVDAQLVGDLITDDDPDTELRDRPPLDEILASPIVATMLGDASGDVLAALGKGQRYTPDQLTGLTGPGLSKLKRIVCDIAVSYLFDRRADKKNEEMAEAFREKADKHLKALKTGEDIFYLGDASDADAGMITTDGPTAIDLRNINRLDERMSSRHLVSSSDRLPLDRR